MVLTAQKEMTVESASSTSHLGGSHIRTIRIRWHQLWLALKHGTPAWLLLTGFAASSLSSYYLAFLTTPNLATQLRYAGAVLEVLGLLLVAIGIRKTRKLFRRPSLVKKTVEWFTLFVGAFKKPEPHTISVASGALNTMVGDVRVEIGVAEGAPLENRVHALEQNLRILRGEIKQTDERVQRSLSEINNAVEDEKNKRISAVESTSFRIEELAVGGLQFEIVGLCWLIVGTLCSSIPTEISRLFGLL